MAKLLFTGNRRATVIRPGSDLCILLQQSIWGFNDQEWHIRNTYLDQQWSQLLLLVCNHFFHL